MRFDRGTHSRMVAAGRRERLGHVHHVAARQRRERGVHVIETRVGEFERRHLYAERSSTTRCAAVSER